MHRIPRVGIAPLSTSYVILHRYLSEKRLTFDCLQSKSFYFQIIAVSKLEEESRSIILVMCFPLVVITI